MTVGRSGTGTLDVTGGGVVSNTDGIIGRFSGSTGSVTVDGVGSQWNNSLDLTVGRFGTGTLDVTAGGVVSNSIGFIGDVSGSGSVTVNGAGSQWNNSSGLRVGDEGTGTLDVTGGGVVSNTDGIIGLFSGSTGSVTVDGAGSQWNNSLSLRVGSGFVTSFGTGTLDVTGGGVVSNTDGFIGFGRSTGSVTVDGAGSQWNNSSDLLVGDDGTGSLDVTGGGVVSNSLGIIGFDVGSTGSVTVDGAGSQWNNSSDLLVGGDGTGTLNINNNGLVTVGGTTSIGTNGTVTLGGGRFEFGSTDLTTFGRIGGTSGSLAGDVDMSGIHNVANLTAFQSSNFDISEVGVANTGTLYGSAFLASNLVNHTLGELRTLGSDFVRFEGIGNVNSGQINNYGGFTEFANDLSNLAGGEINVSGVLSAGEITNNLDAIINLNAGNLIADQTIVNEMGGLISGRGVIRADGGFTNNGNLALSGGTTDFRGGAINNGLVITSGNSTTTFFNGLENQSEIRTADGSSVVVFEDFTGAGNFTGSGDVFFEGSVSGGNSPAVIGFGGDLTLSSTSTTLFELAGLEYGEFDRFEVGGDLYINGGNLNWTTLDGFQLGYGQEFVVADVAGSLFGQFNGFGEGDLLGNQNGHNLFITYIGGDGNDVAFFTAVPEPSAGVVLILLAMATGLKRRRFARS